MIATYRYEAFDMPAKTTLNHKTFLFNHGVTVKNLPQIRKVYDRLEHRCYCVLYIRRNDSSMAVRNEAIKDIILAGFV